MKQNLTLAILSAALTLGTLTPLQAQPLLAWDDSNPTSANVLRYIIYTNPGGGNMAPYRTVDQPKTADGVVTVTTPLLPDLAGKTIAVTAVNGLGLESLPSDPLTLPPFADAPFGLRMLFDFTSRTLVLTWEDGNLTSANVTGYKVYKTAAAGSPEVIGETELGDRRFEVNMPADGTPIAFSVTAKNLWGESVQSPAAPIPTLAVPVTNLRIIASP